MPLDVTVIVPNYNGAERLDRLLATVAGQTAQPAAVLVVDNASTDRSVEAACRWGAEVVSLPANHGFARAVNEGILRARTGWVAIVNNDVTLSPDWLEILARQAEETKAWFATGRISSLADPALLDGTFDLLTRSGLAWRAGHGCTPSAALLQPRGIHFAPLTAALFRREVFSRAGMLEEDFESYLEDVDLGLRCAMEGLAGAYVPDAQAWHEGAATLGAWSPSMTRLLSRNQLLLIARHWPPLWRSGLFRPVLAGQLLWGVLALRRGVLFAWCRGKLEGLKKWKKHRKPSSPSARLLIEVLHESERLLFSLEQPESSRFWRVYFRLAGRPRSEI
jgi:GT2 family glycosyltransferase